MLYLYPRDVLDEIRDLIESVSEGSPTYFFKLCHFGELFFSFIGYGVCVIDPFYRFPMDSFRTLYIYLRRRNDMCWAY